MNNSINFKLKPSLWSHSFYAIMLLIIFIPLGIIAIWEMPLIGVFILIGCALISFFSYVNWLAVDIAVQDGNIWMKISSLNSITRKIEIRDIKSVIIDIPLSQRFFGTGNIALNTSATEEGTLVLRHIKHPEAVAQKIEMIKKQDLR